MQKIAKNINGKIQTLFIKRKSIYAKIEPEILIKNILAIFTTEYKYWNNRGIKSRVKMEWRSYIKFILRASCTTFNSETSSSQKIFLQEKYK